MIEREPIMGLLQPELPMYSPPARQIPDLMQFENTPLNETAYPFTHELPDLMQFEYATLNESAPAEILGHPNLPEADWSNWITEAEVPNIAGSLIIADRYSKLLDSLQWFEFANWLTPKLENLLRPRSSSPGISTHATHSGDEKLPLIVKNVMGLSKVQSGGMQKAVQVLSGMIPERFHGELAGKINGLNTTEHAKIQAAELLLSLLANNHKSLSGTNASQVRIWIMEIPVALLELILQKKDPTAVAISNRMLVWSIEHGYSDVFRQLLKAKIDKTYLSGAEGGRLLLKGLKKYSLSSDILIDIINCDISLHERNSDKESALHLAAMYRGPECLQALIEQGANLKAMNKDYRTPFEQAFIYQQVRNVKWFLENGVTTEELNKAIRLVHVPPLEMCTMLWERDPKISRKLPVWLLIYSAISGPDEFATKVTEISQFYDDTASILEAALCTAMTLLHDLDLSESFHYHYWDSISREYDDDDDDEDYDEKHPPLIGVDVVKIFLDHGVDPNTSLATDKPPPLLSAMRFWTAEELSILLNYGAKLDHKDITRTLFCNPLSKGRFEMIRLIFLDKKMKINMTRRLPSGWFPFQAICAIHKGSEGFAMVKYFAEAGAEINSLVSAGQNYTALHFAVQHGQLETTRYLIKKGAKVRQWLKAPKKSLYELCVMKCPSACCWGQEEGYQPEVAKRAAIWELLLDVHAEG